MVVIPLKATGGKEMLLSFFLVLTVKISEGEGFLTAGAPLELEVPGINGIAP